MKEIKVNSRKYGEHVALVDDEDFEIVSKYRWHIVRRPNTWYAEATISRGKTKTLHRFILNLNETTLTADHINGNGLDNRRINLRICTQKENARNSKIPNTSTTGYKGVCFVSARKKFIAGIVVNDKRIALGEFRTKEEAALRYNEAAKKYFGEFARLNEVPCAG